MVLPAARARALANTVRLCFDTHTAIQSVPGCAKNYTLQKAGKKVNCVKVKPTKPIEADTVYIHASIYTVDDKSTTYPDGALATNAGRIVWIGKSSDIASKVDMTKAIVIDAKGHAMTPGFIECVLREVSWRKLTLSFCSAHLHAVKGGTALLSCDLNYASLDLKSLVALVQKCVDAEPKKNKPTDWLLVASFDRASFLSNNNGHDLTAKMLDTIKTERPIFVQTMDQHSGQS
jgi:predicted amidohydrolase YtcJ